VTVFVLGKQGDVARLGAVALFAFAPLFADAQTVVVGANDRAVDLPAVQAAVNGGGRVILKGTFDFGSAGRVIINNDVDIGGEIDVHGTPVTTIGGGEWSFHTPYPTQMPPPVAGPKVAVHDLHFVGARGTAIHLAYCGGAELRNNLIHQMRARQTGATSERAAIVVGPAILGNLPGKTLPNSSFADLLISGDIVIADNRIDVSVDPSATPTETTTTMRSTGMFVSMYKGADVRIERNFVTGNTRTGLAILDGEFGKFGANRRGSLVIAGNTVSSDVRIGFTQPGPRAPLGIVTGFNNQREIGADPHRAMIPVLITDNVIELNGATSMGIVNIWNGAVLTGNRITVHTDINKVVDRLSTSGGILAAGSSQILMHNRIEGEGCNAIRYGGTMDGQERFGSVSKANNVAHFSPFEGGFDKCATFWLEPASHDNVVVGDSGSAIDEGINNKVTGLQPVSGGVGQAVSAAVHTAAERTEELATFGFE
jgi:hypothetical protein